MCLAVPLLILAVIVIVLSARVAMRRPGDMGASVPSILGIGLTLSSLFGAWVEFSPAAYVLSEFFQEFLPQGAAFLLELLGKEGFAKVVSLLESVLAIPGTLLPILSNAGWGVRLAPILVGVVGVLALLWFPLGQFRKTEARFRVAWGQTIVAFVAAGLLLTAMPSIDLLIGRQYPEVGALAVLAGARVGPSVWQAFLGLVLLGIGGLIQVISLGGLPRTEG